MYNWPLMTQAMLPAKSTVHQVELVSHKNINPIIFCKQKRLKKA
jgi:hypothetical protein